MCRTSRGSLSRSRRPKTRPSYWFSMVKRRRAAAYTRASRSKRPVISSSRTSPTRSVRPRASPSASTLLARSVALASSRWTRSTWACSTAISWAMRSAVDPVVTSVVLVKAAGSFAGVRGIHESTTRGPGPSDQARPDGVGPGLEAGRRVELLHEAGDHPLHGALGDASLPGDHGVGRAGCEEGEDEPVASRQVVGREGGAKRRRLVVDPADELLDGPHQDGVLDEQ